MALAFVPRPLCHWQIRILLFLIFWCVFLVFRFVTSLHRLELPGLCIIAMVGVDNLAFLLFSGKSIQSFTSNYAGSWWSFVDVLYRVEAIPPISSLFRVFIMNRCWILSNAFSVVHPWLRGSCDFAGNARDVSSIPGSWRLPGFMVDYIDWVLNIESPLDPPNKPYLVAVYD